MSSKSYVVFDKEISEAETSEPIVFIKEYHLSFLLVADPALSCTATIEISNDGENFVATTITLSAGASPDLQELDTAASVVRVALSGVSGSGNLKLLAHGK